MLEKVEEVEIKEEVDFDDDEALPQGSALRLRLASRPPRQHPSSPRKHCLRYWRKQSQQRWHRMCGGRPLPAAHCQASPAASSPSAASSTILKVPTFLKGEPSSTDRCTTLTGMLRGRFQDQRPLDFDEDYFVDVHQLCDKFNRKTRSNIGYKTLFKIFACDPKCRFNCPRDQASFGR